MSSSGLAASSLLSALAGVFRDPEKLSAKAPSAEIENGSKKMAVQSYSENECEIRKNIDYKNNGDSILVDRTSFTVILFSPALCFIATFPFSIKCLLCVL